VPVITDYEIWKNNPEKVLGVTRAWAEKYPNPHLALLKAMIRAAQWLDASAANRREAAALIAKPQYVGADVSVISASMTGTFEYAPGEKRAVPDFNVFWRYHATYPFYSDAVWYLTQMRRWGQLEQGRPDSWYIETAKKVYRPDIYVKAAQLLLEEGRVAKADVPWDSDGFRPPAKDFIDGMTYDGRKPNAYIDGFAIGLKGQQKIEGANVVGK
jgi:nitrate/nitrite transport system substrate-binding protein